jgi:exodeoxyribonuclease III
MQVTTWNVNSIRTRLQIVIDWLEDHPSVDVLCLQETKVVDQDFPYEAFTELGYYTHVYGQKSYNGVAFISRQPMSDISCGFTPVVAHANEYDDQKRVISGRLNGVRIVNLYVPNGSSLDSDKYTFKLSWLDILRQYLESLLKEDSSQKIVICGDFNVAIADIDIHNATKRASQVMATDAERDALQAVLNLGFKDLFRKFTPEAGHYSWWDYRGGSFKRNSGWRIDYHFATESLYEHAIACTIDPNPRALTQPSDHAPVTVEFEL